MKNADGATHGAIALSRSDRTEPDKAPVYGNRTGL